MKQNIKLNYIYQSSWQILNLMVPLITTPYVSRVLEADGVGAFSYVYSVICYLIIFSNLGINAYAQRKISTLQEDERSLKKFFWQIIGAKLINFVLPSAIYIVIILTSSKYSTLFAAEIFFFLGAPVNITWYYTGMEDFRRVVQKGLLAKVIGIALLFIIIKTKSDIYLYAIILGGTQFMGDILLWVNLPAYIRRGIPSLMSYWEHVVGGCKMLMPELASSIFAYGDKVMLGFLLVSTVENGYYEQSQKIISLSQGVVNAVATVMLPRIASLYSKQDKKAISYYMDKTMAFLSFIGIPIAFGISGIASSFVPWFFGAGYENVENLLYILSPIAFVHGIYYILGYQYLLGTNQEIKFTRYILIGAVSNTILNFMLIPKLGAIGASIASLVSEIAISIMLLYVARHVMNVNTFLYNCVKPMIAGSTMFVILCLLNRKLVSGMLATALLIICGGVIYFVMMLVMRDRVLLNELTIIKERWENK